MDSVAINFALFNFDWKLYFTVQLSNTLQEKNMYTILAALDFSLTAVPHVQASYLLVVVPRKENQIIRIGYDFVGEREMVVRQSINQDIPEIWRQYTALWTA